MAARAATRGRAAQPLRSALAKAEEGVLDPVDEEVPVPVPVDDELVPVGAVVPLLVGGSVVVPVLVLLLLLPEPEPEPVPVEGMMGSEETISIHA